jgi:hypothetical protein
MQEVFYVVLGWLLGLLGPRIIDSIKDHYDRRKLAIAIRSEAQTLQYRVAISGFHVAQKFGEVSKEYLNWLHPKLVQYQGNEPSAAILKHVEYLINAPDEQVQTLIEHLRAEKNGALSLKRFSCSLVDSSLESIQRFPIEYQKRIHEFRNHLNMLNEEIANAVEYHRMTFDSSMSSDNYDIVAAELVGKYRNIQEMCKRVADRLQFIIDFEASGF